MVSFDPSTLDFRSSRFGDLCGEKGLGTTGEDWVYELVIEELRKTYIPGFSGNKHTEKGNLVEQSAIDRWCNIIGWGPTIKSSVEFRDHIGTGHPDIWKPRIDARADMKSVWTEKTFPWRDSELKNKKYLYQALRYCMQANVPDWWVVYVLENTPDHLVLLEANQLWKASGESGYIKDRHGDFVSPAAAQFYDQVKTLHTFDHLPDWRRVKPFKVTLTDKDITFIEKRAEMAREYAKQLFKADIKHEQYIKSLRNESNR